MLDSYNREISYLRISLTDSCDLRCRYCMPEYIPYFLESQHLLSFEQIQQVVQVAVDLGFNKFRLTGGEPLIRPNVVQLVKTLSQIEGVETLAMTTNGTLLSKYAKPLKEAGLQSVNISLDTLDPVRYNFITRGGDISKVLSGIDSALDVGLDVKINMVMIDNKSVKELSTIKSFIEHKGGQVQTIAMYQLDQTKVDQHIYDRPENCSLCNRIRLTADGKIRTCLHSDDVHILDFDDLHKSLKLAIESKPKQGSTSSNVNVSAIGG